MTVNAASGGNSGVRIAALTMVSNEIDMLPRWLEYYGSQFGRDALFVIDDDSDDGSTDDIGCSVLKLPPAPWRDTWQKSRKIIVNSMARALLQTFDAILFTDVDEFVVPDPAKYDGLRDYVLKRQDQDVLAAVGLNLLHDVEREPELDAGRPVLEQRRLVKFIPGLCKPLLKRSPLEWSSGTHGIKSRFEIDPDLLMIHLKYYDDAQMRRIAEMRRLAFEGESRGAPASAWPLGGEELSRRMRRWVDDPAPAELDTHRLPLPVPELSNERGIYKVFGAQLDNMEKNPLLRLPERFLSAAPF